MSDAINSFDAMNHRHHSNLQSKISNLKSSPDRLPPIWGEWIDRTQTLHFTFEDNSFRGYAGDTITSALWASGQRILGRSFKYHRPRGILSFANHDINVLMQSGQALNVRADITPLETGMALSAVNTAGGLMGDRSSVLNVFSPFYPLGFTIKRFTISDCFLFGNASFATSVDWGS